MAHFALIENETVRRVIVVNDADAPDEATGQAFIASIGLAGQWVQTSYSGSIRGKYAGPGDLYDPVADTFASPAASFVSDQALSAAYERGKTDGAAEASLSMQADAIK